MSHPTLTAAAAASAHGIVFIGNCPQNACPGELRATVTTGDGAPKSAARWTWSLGCDTCGAIAASERVACRACGASSVVYNRRAHCPTCGWRARALKRGAGLEVVELRRSGTPATASA